MDEVHARSERSESDRQEESSQSEAWLLRRGTRRLPRRYPGGTSVPQRRRWRPQRDLDTTGGAAGVGESSAGQPVLVGAPDPFDLCGLFWRR
jgi:hypothetical protein